jgi:hypothetical protein
MRLLRILGCHDAMFGPHDVLDTVRREVGVIAEHRRVARDALRTQLLSVESRWAWLASWLSNDSGDWHRRDAWADRALQLAHEAGDASDDLDRAAGEGMKALDMTRSTKSEMTMRDLKRLDHRLAACDAPAAADVHEAFAALHPS